MVLRARRRRANAWLTSLCERRPTGMSCALANGNALLSIRPQTRSLRFSASDRTIRNKVWSHARPLRSHLLRTPASRRRTSSGARAEPRSVASHGLPHDRRNGAKRSGSARAHPSRPQKMDDSVDQRRTPPLLSRAREAAATSAPTTFPIGRREGSRRNVRRNAAPALRLRQLNQSWRAPLGRHLDL